MAKVLEKIGKFRKIIKENGGIIGSYMNLYRTEELKTGTHIFTDKFGNKYYENNSYFFARNRWVDFPLSEGVDYDASQIPAEWHRWLHNIGDGPPTTHPPVKRRWMLDHKQNFSGTDREYVPYSTTRPKIESWVPPKK